jgi:hypothetical protein
MNSMTSSQTEQIAPALPSGRWVSITVNTLIVAAVILAALAALGRESRNATHPVSAGIDSTAPQADSPQQ